jgi:2-succinyl-5-enolpyruvyl-6-hydroxy-3-cyclohexene-1-carboxylate synthase
MSMLNPPVNALYAYIGAFAEELARSGVRHAVVCPGSRSTPLALAIAETPGIRLWMHVDERSAAYFGLGLAKRTGHPIALLCSSGTAAANFLPAVVEAHLARVPLVVLTADRPHELRDCGAPQAIDQIRLYGAFAKWFADVALPEAGDDALRYVRTLADRAVATARATPAGPVHLNFPLREPLTPDPGLLPPVEARDLVAWQGRLGGSPYSHVWETPPAAPSAAIGHMATLVPFTPRGLIIAGPGLHRAHVEYLTDLARQTGYPLLADPLSQVRSAPHPGDHLPISSYDAFLRSERFVSAAAPQLVLRFGAMPTSKPLLLYLKRYAHCRQIVVGLPGTWEEPTQLASEMLHCEPASFCHDLGVALSGLPATEYEGARAPWRKAWSKADEITRATLAAATRRFPTLFEGRVFSELAELLPAGAHLVVGNSMPVRDCDTFFWPNGKRIHVYGNRGANGIDGVVSTALGIAATSDGANDGDTPTVLVIGDLSFYHDLNGMLAARLHGLNLTVVLVNNDGGGIFSFLPQADHPDHFERLFGTPTGLDFSHAVRMYGGDFTRIADWDAFRVALRAGMSGGGLHVVEVPTARASNVALHRELWRAVDAALDEASVFAALGGG